MASSLYEPLTLRDVKIRQKIPGSNWVGYGLLLVNDNLWFLQDRKIQLLSREGKPLKSVAGGINGGRGCSLSPDGGVLVATLHAGLQEFTTSGSCHGAIASGRYWDVCCVGEKVFALHEDENEEDYAIHVLKRKSDTWLKTQDIPLDLPYSKDNRLTLAVLDSGMFVCSYNDKKLYSIDSSGSCQAVYGRPGVEQPGDLWEPHICAHDSQVILIGDRDNHRLQVFSPSNSEPWKVVKIMPENTMKNPYAAITDPKTGTLYIIGEPRGKYYLYACQ